MTEEKSSVESADRDDRGAVQSAIETANESASTYTGESTESAEQNTESNLGFSPRDNAGSEPRSDRDSGRRSSNSNRVLDRRPNDRAIPDLTPTSTIYVGNLLFDITASDLQREFGKFGTILSTDIAADNRGLSKG